MELGTLFTTSKWDILEALSHKPMSPLQLSSSLATSPANVSQQVRLLEMAGLLAKEKVPNRDSGMPRTLFSLKDDFSYLVTVSKEGAKKGLIPTDAKKRLILHTWMAGSPALEQLSFDLVTAFQNRFEGIGCIAWDPTHNLLFLVMDDKESYKEELEAVRDSALRNQHHVQVLGRKHFQEVYNDRAASGEQTIQLLVTDTHLSQQINRD